MYNILTQFSIPMKLVRLIKICLNATYVRVKVGKHLSNMFPMFLVRNYLKQGDALSPLHFTLAVEYATGRVQVHQDELKFNGTHQLLVYAYDVNILGRSIHTIKENAEALVVACKETVLEVNADKTKYMVISRDQNAGQTQSIKTDNSYFERVEDF